MSKDTQILKLKLFINISQLLNKQNKNLDLILDRNYLTVLEKITLYLCTLMTSLALTHALSKLAVMPGTASLPSCSEQNVTQQLGNPDLHICSLVKDSTQW